MAEEKKDAKVEKEDEKHYIVLTDDKGKDTKVELLFSIVYKKNNTRYLFVVDPTDDESVIIFSADDEGNLESMSEDNMDPSLREYLEDTFQAFQSGDLTPVEDGDEGEEEEVDEEDEDDSKDEDDHECCCGEDEECHCHDDEKSEGCSCKEDGSAKKGECTCHHK